MVFVKAARDALLRPLQVVSGIVERRQTLPILANVLVRKDGEKVTFTATDLEIQIQTSAEVGAGKDAVATTVAARKLVDITYECLMLGIEQARPGNTIGDIGYAIQRHAEAHRYGVVRDFCGHGLGRLFHDSPEVVHAGRPGSGPELRPGMFFTIEPMINIGRPDCKLLDDGWTAVTRDRSLSAQFEHSIGITEDGCEIFTKSPSGLDKPPY